MVGGAAERWQSENTDLGFGFVYCRGARAHVAAPQSYRHRRRWRLSHESLRLADHSITKSAQPYSSALRQRMLRGLRRNTNGVPYRRRRRARQGRRLSARFVGQNASGVPCRIYRSLETQRFDFDRRQSRARATRGPSSATPRRDRKQISVHAVFGANRKEGHLKSGLRFEAVNPFTEKKKDWNDGWPSAPRAAGVEAHLPGELFGAHVRRERFYRCAGSRASSTDPGTFGWYSRGGAYKERWSPRRFPQGLPSSAPVLVRRQWKERAIR